MENERLKRLKRSLNQNFPRAVQRNSNLIFGLAAALIILMGTAIGAYLLGNNPVDDFLQGIVEPERQRMEEITEEVETPLEFTALILRNNLVAITLIIGMGIGFGIYPICSLASNALIIGYFGASLNLPAPDAISLFMPHGPLELSAFVIATSCGLRLGIESARSVFKRSTDPIREAGKDVADLLPGAFFLMIIAGFLEGTVFYFPGILKIGAGILLFFLMVLWLKRPASGKN